MNNRLTSLRKQREEIDRHIERLESNSGKPELQLDPAENLDFKDVISMCQDNVERIIRDGWEDEDFQHYLYEAVLSVIYGEDYWDWHRTAT